MQFVPITFGNTVSSKKNITDTSVRIILFWDVFIFCNLLAVCINCHVLTV
uniref:Uncharacterized protein n=1 Tax=Anguilla anguilla TaxID=7936 RepID=A0A0E9TFL5_ANGAN